MDAKTQKNVELLMEISEAVSYTHLDVYKRQTPYTQFPVISDIKIMEIIIEKAFKENLCCSLYKSAAAT